MYGMWQGVLTETYFSGTYAVSLPDKLLFVFFLTFSKKREEGGGARPIFYEAYQNGSNEFASDKIYPELKSLESA